MSDAVWISIVGGVVSLLSLLMTLLIKKDQTKLATEMNGHMTKILEIKGEAEKAKGKLEGIEEGKDQQKVIQQDAIIKDLEVKVSAQITDPKKDDPK